MNIIYSKVKDKNWPWLNCMLSKISEYVTKGRLIVQLYDADEKKILNEERAVRFENLKIKLALEFNSSEAAQGLKQDIDLIEGDWQQQ